MPAKPFQIGLVYHFFGALKAVVETNDLETKCYISTGQLSADFGTNAV